MRTFKVWTIIKVIILATVVILAIPSISKSHEGNPNFHFKYVKETPWGPMLEFKGTFVTGLKNEFIRQLSKYKDIKIVSMSSPGGLLMEGYEVGKVLSNYRLTTWVPRDQACISACALAFIGGENYKVSGVLAFHAPWLPKYDGSQKLMDIYSQGQNTGSTQSYWFAANGFRAQLYMAITQYTNRDTFMLFTNSGDLNHFLMYPERTYEEYLEWKDSPSTILQGTGELIAAIVKRKRLEVLRNMGEFNFQGSGGDYPSYKQLQKNLRPDSTP